MSHTARTRGPRGRRIVAAVGWLLVGAGTLIALYLAYSLVFTGLFTVATQAELLDQWERQVGPVDGTDDLDTRAPLPSASTRSVQASRPDAQQAALPGRLEPAPPAPGRGDAVAVLEFARPQTDAKPVQDDRLLVVEGVGVDELKRGPGHYPGTALPGQPGNFAVAGHRTTYAAPFYDLDELQAGDLVHVTDRSGTRWTYSVVGQRTVAPTDVEVIGPDPLGSGQPTLTLTTCHPRFSAAQRLIVFAELTNDEPA